MSNPVAVLRLTNRIEAVSYLFLVGVAMPLKYVWNLPEAVTIVGWIHGVLFAVFCWSLVRVMHTVFWPLGRFVGVFFAALVPVLPFLVDRRFPRWEAEWNGLVATEGEA